VEIDGRSGGLSGPGDRQLFKVLRSLADVILVGSGTVRAEKYKPARPAAMVPALRAGRPATPPIAVVSGTLDLDPESPLLTAAPPDARTVVLTSKAAPADRRAALARHAEIIEAGTDRVSMAAAVRALGDLGHARILCEGGPGLLGQLMTAGLLDELCLTVSPVLAGGQAGRILVGGPPGPDDAAGTEPLDLGHVLADGGFLFCRYVRAQT
jgi:riboflavin biosynthesis pyrimidine reductase